MGHVKMTAEVAARLSKALYEATGEMDPALVAVVAVDPFWSYRFARDVLRGPFPDGEASIATDLWIRKRYEDGLTLGFPTEYDLKPGAVVAYVPAPDKYNYILSHVIMPDRLHYEMTYDAALDSSVVREAVERLWHGSSIKLERVVDIITGARYAADQLASLERKVLRSYGAGNLRGVMRAFESHKLPRVSSLLHEFGTVQALFHQLREAVLERVGPVY